MRRDEFFKLSGVGALSLFLRGLTPETASAEDITEAKKIAEVPALPVLSASSFAWPVADYPYLDDEFMPRTMARVREWQDHIQMPRIVAR